LVREWLLVELLGRLQVRQQRAHLQRSMKPLHGRTSQSVALFLVMASSLVV
jgi:hypothetical protein